METVTLPAGEPAAAAPMRARRQRSVTEILLSIVLALEAILVFFIMLVVFGLDILEPGPTFAGGGALIALLVLDARFVRWRWGVWFGWILQLLLVATGLLVPLMYVIAAMFLAIWVYCFVKGRQLDRRNAFIEERMRAESADQTAPTQGDTNDR